MSHSRLVRPRVSIFLFFQSIEDDLTMAIKRSWLAAMAISCCVAGTAGAADKAEKTVNAADKQSFATVSEWVDKQMSSGGRYAYVTAAERSKVNGLLGEMGKEFDKHPTVAEMSPADKERLFNEQEEVNAILGKRDNQRLICRSETPVGSHIPVKTCETAGTLEARRRNDQDYLQRTLQTSGVQSAK